MAVRTLVAALLATAVLAGCSPGGGGGAEPSAPPPPPAVVVPTTASSTTPSPPPGWQVGAHPLPLRPDGYGAILPTPPELVVRRLPTRDVLPPPAGSGFESTVFESTVFESTVEPVPAEVLARSTWQPNCPVTPAQLRYLTMSFWGFDGRAHTGEMIVNARVAGDVVLVFRQLYGARFPIEEMRVVSQADLSAPPTGDGNNTSAFACRAARGLRRFSAHAYGLAIDLNPFCNPYTSTDLVLPELASAYLDRSRVRPGMLLPGDPAVRAFTEIGWTWGGIWRSPRDLMHFSATGN